MLRIESFSTFLSHIHEKLLLLTFSSLIHTIPVDSELCITAAVNTSENHGLEYVVFLQCSSLCALNSLQDIFALDILQPVKRKALGILQTTCTYSSFNPIDQNIFCKQFKTIL